MLLKNKIVARLNDAPFEWVCVAAFIIYVGLCLTPSSYGLVLNLFGMTGEGLLWGSPRAIRSDEWAVWTPYFQSLVNNDYSRFNNLSLYHEDFRGFSALPIYDWAIVFKPLMWPFLFFNEAYAFSMHHALIMLSFVIGWKRLLDRLIPETQQYFISALFSLLLFFSAFVQVWWTTLGPLLALTPWLFIVVIWCEKITPFKVFVYSYVAIAWLLSHTYPPIIISCAYIALLMLIVFKRELFNKTTIIGLSIGSGVALAIVYLYFADAIQIMSQTVYPGKRVSQGAAVPWELWVSAFIPYVNHSNYEPLFNLNICEIGVVSSLLPMMAITFISYSSLAKESIKIIIYFSITLLVLSLWMLAPVPLFIAKILLLDHIPGSRLVWALGVLLNILALYVLSKSRIELSLKRIAIFAVVVFSFYAASCYYYGLPLGKKSAWELLSVFILLSAYWLLRNRLVREIQKTSVILFSAVMINVIYFGAFNPGQSAKPIFELKNSPAVALLKEQQNTHSKGWLVTTGYPGAVLQGLELNAVTHVLMMPKLNFFRELFPHMNEADFNKVFNRYAHIHLSDESKPYSPQADVILVPKYVFGLEEKPSIKQLDITQIGSDQYSVGGYVDRIDIDGEKITLSGWGMVSDSEIVFLSNFHDKISAKVEKNSRPDVVSALNDSRLAMSGFTMKFERPDALSIETLCLYTKDSIFGVKQILPGSLDMLYKCANK